ncbi:hypothetical protein BZA77DRAFT_359166 [Pyronema omphalodes]|nr:hypothetical protein BZA77DRAFT_359166 [Pyronema omphalodes]
MVLHSIQLLVARSPLPPFSPRACSSFRQRATGSFVHTDFGPEDCTEGTQLARDHSVEEDGTTFYAVEPSSPSPPPSTRLDPVNITAPTPTTPMSTYHGGIKMGSNLGPGASSNKKVKRERPTIGGQIIKSLSELKDTAMKL